MLVEFTAPVLAAQTMYGGSDDTEIDHFDFMLILFVFFNIVIYSVFFLYLFSVFCIEVEEKKRKRVWNRNSSINDN